MSEGIATIETNERKTMRLYEVLTGEIVRIYAENEDEMWEKLANNEGEFVEAESQILFVGAEVETEAN